MSSRMRWFIVGLLCVGMIVAYFDRVNLSAALGDKEAAGLLPKEFGLSDSQRGSLGAAFFIAYAALQVPAGWLVDRFGVKWPFAIGFAFWSVVSAATSLTTSFRQLFAVRMSLALGESVITPAGMRWIRFHCAENQRGLAVGLYMAAAKIGPAIGTPLAALLIGWYGWRPMFVILGLGCLLWLIPWLKYVEDDDRAIEARQAKKSATAAVPFSAVLASPLIWGTVIGTFCYQYFVYFLMTWGPAYFKEHHKLSLNWSSLFTGTSFAGMAIVATAAGWIADRLIDRGRDPVRVRKGFTIAGLLTASTVVVATLTSSTPVAIFFAIFALSGLGLMTANYWALTQTLVPGAAVGRIVGIQNCAANLPGIFASYLTGWLLEVTHSWYVPVRIVAGLLLVGVASYLLLVRPKYAPRAAALMVVKT